MAKLSFLLLALLVASVSCASAEYFEDDTASDQEDGEGRTVFTSNGNYFIALNTTYLLLYAALFGAGLLAAIALASLFSPAEDTGYGYGYQQQQGYGGAGGGHHGYRTKRDTYYEGKGSKE